MRRNIDGATAGFDSRRQRMSAIGGALNHQLD